MQLSCHSPDILYTGWDQQCESNLNRKLVTSKGRCSQLSSQFKTQNLHDIVVLSGISLMTGEIIQGLAMVQQMRKSQASLLRKQNNNHWTQFFWSYFVHAGFQMKSNIYPNICKKCTTFSIIHLQYAIIINSHTSKTYNNNKFMISHKTDYSMEYVHCRDGVLKDLTWVQWLELRLSFQSSGRSDELCSQHGTMPMIWGYSCIGYADESNSQCFTMYIMSQYSLLMKCQTACITVPLDR